MQLVNTPTGLYVDENPKTLTPGTMISAINMNNIQGEIANVILDNGGTLDGTNYHQLSETLVTNFAKLNSPALVGTPTAPTPPQGDDTTKIATTAFVQNVVTAGQLPYTPVRQGTGTGMGSNTISLGASSSNTNSILIQRDDNALGPIVLSASPSSDDGSVARVVFSGNNTSVPAFVDETGKYCNLVPQTYMSQNNFIPSLPAGNDETLTNLYWSTGSILPHAFFSSGNAYLTTTDWVNNLIDQLLPYGTIKLFYGSISSINTNYWAYCDGTRGTPDLRNQFIIGSSGSGAGLGIVGQGQSIYGTVDGHTLSVDEIPSHTHGYEKARGGGFRSSGSDTYYAASPGNSAAVSDATGGTGSHNHTFSIPRSELSPVAQSLHYIMKIV